jgi:hypothetical protein
MGSKPIASLSITPKAAQVYPSGGFFFSPLQIQQAVDQPAFSPGPGKKTLAPPVVGKPLAPTTRQHQPCASQGRWWGVLA